MSKVGFNHFVNELDIKLQELVVKVESKLQKSFEGGEFSEVPMFEAIREKDRISDYLEMMEMMCNVLYGSDCKKVERGILAALAKVFQDELKRIENNDYSGVSRKITEIGD